MHDSLYSAVFNVTYTCNDSCSFCFNRNLLNKSQELSLDKIKKSYFYIKEKFNIQKVIIAGGEPSMHSQFWDIMSFFYNEVGTEVSASLNTNSLNFIDKGKEKKLLNFFLNCDSLRKALCLSLSSVQDPLSLSFYEKKKLLAVTKMIKLGFNSSTHTSVVIIITKKNYKALNYFSKLFTRIMSNFPSSTLTIKLRLPYLGKYMTKKQIEENVEFSFDKIKPYISLFIHSLLNVPNINVSIFNIPLCHLKDSFDFDNNKKRFFAAPKIQRIIIDNKTENEKIVPEFLHQDSFEIESCNRCLLKQHCSRVQKDYLDLGIINDLYPVL